MKLPPNLKRNLTVALIGSLLLAVCGAEYYRYTLNTAAADKEAQAKKLQGQAAALRQREQKLEPDKALLARLQSGLLNPKDGQMEEQLLKQILADEARANGVELHAVVAGNRGLLGGANRYSMTVQVRGTAAAALSFLQAVETGPVTARITVFSNIAPDGGSANTRTVTMNIDFYARAK